MATQLIKKLMGIHPQSNVNPLKNLSYYGSDTQGYTIPDNFLNTESIVYLVGAGEDISFDLEIKAKFDAEIYIFDPSPYGINHFKEVKEFIHHHTPITVNTARPPLQYKISPEQFDDIKFIAIGLWDEKKILKFYDPEKEDYASHSAYLFTDSKKFIEVPVDRLGNLMKRFGHMHIDLLKMEIEGAEYKVIETIIEDKLDVRAIAVEFDEVFNSIDKSFHLRIKRSCDQLRKAGYVLVHSTNEMKRLFIQRDIYDQFKKKEADEKRG